MRAENSFNKKMIPISRPSIGNEEVKAVADVLKSGTIAQGPKVREFESLFAKFIGAENAVAVNSGTAALHCALYAAGIKPGDEVITTPFSFVATANSILMQGAKPVFADIEEGSCNINVKNIEEKITKKTKAVIAVDLYGHPYDYEGMKKIAERHSLQIIEDACQAIGAECNGRKCGTLGDIGTFSFYATKNITTAEGGMLTTGSDEFAELARRFRHHGQSEKTRYEYFDLGFNYRMTDINAAIGVEQLKKIEGWNRKRAENAAYLSKRLGKIKGIKVPVVKEGCIHAFHQYTIKVEEGFKLKREQLIEHLGRKGIGTGIYYPKPLHLFSHLRGFGYSQGDFPVAEKISQQVLSLPVHPGLSKDDLGHIADAFAELE